MQKKTFNTLNVNIIWGCRHLHLATFASNIGAVERIKHIGLGLFELIPILGHLLSALDHSIFQENKIIDIEGNTPYERGFQFGKKLRNETQVLYKHMLASIVRTAEFETKRKELIDHLPPDLKEEMRGLAEGAGVKIDEVYDIHAFLDISTSRYGCSALATHEVDGKVERIAAANNFSSEMLPQPREERLSEVPLDSDIRSYEHALHHSTVDTTLQSIVFDPQNGDVHIASSWTRAADKSWTRRHVFNTSTASSAPSSRTILARNLDWPTYLLGSQTVIVRTKGEGIQEFVNVTFPGYLGVLSGMNQSRLSLACCQAGGEHGVGMPITLLFRKIIEHSSNVQEAITHIKETPAASSMNLAIAGDDGVAVVEIHAKKEGTEDPVPHVRSATIEYNINFVTHLQKQLKDAKDINVLRSIINKLKDAGDPKSLTAKLKEKCDPSIHWLFTETAPTPSVEFSRTKELLDQACVLVIKEIKEQEKKAALDVVRSEELERQDGNEINRYQLRGVHDALVRGDYSPSVLNTLLVNRDSIAVVIDRQVGHPEYENLGITAINSFAYDPSHNQETQSLIVKALKELLGIRE